MNKLQHHNDQGLETIELPYMAQKSGYIFAKGANPVSYRATHGDYEIIHELRTIELNFLAERFPDKRVIILKQMHGDEYALVTHQDYEKRRQREGEPFIWGQADAIITREEGFALTIVTADCLPIFLYAPGASVFAAIHAGWQGTHKRITEKVGRAIFNMGVSNKQLYAAILPGIAQKDYEVREDVAQYFPDYITHKEGRIYLDIIGANRDQLRSLGISQERIGYVPLTTFGDNDKLYSHRKKDVGRNLNVLLC